MNAEQLLTNTGINFPIDLSESQFMDAGRMLAKIEKGMQWAIGDYYNAIKDEDKKEVIESVGLNYKTAKSYACICREFSMVARITSLTFKHHQLATHKKIDANQRKQLLDQAAKHGWSARHLLDQRNQTQGLDKPKLKKQDIEPTKEAGENLDIIEQEVNNLIKKVSDVMPVKRLRIIIVKGIKTIINILQNDFENQVYKKMNERLEKARLHLEEAEQEAERLKMCYTKLITPLNGIMTSNELKVLISLCHPDRHSNSLQSNQGFKILMKLKESIPNDLPAKAKKAQGWD